jgi:hypothetical protein
MFLAAFALLAVVVAPVFAGAAPQASWGSAKSKMLDYRSIEGKVTALDLKAKTMRVAAAEGSVTGPVTVTFTDKTIVRQGMLHRNAADIHVGEPVDMTYAGWGDKWVADSINIRESSVAVAQYAGLR